jgi:hypothetical protein
VGGVTIVKRFGSEEQEVKISDSPAMYENDASLGGELLDGWMAGYK